MGNMLEKVVKIRIDEDVWKAFRHLAVERDLTMPAMVGSLIYREVNESGTGDPGNEADHRLGERP